MNILLFHPEKQASDMISFCLESQMSLTVHPVSTFQKAVDFLLEEAAIDLIITNLQPETDKLFKYLLSTGANIPVILVNNEKKSGIEAYPEIRVLANIQQSEVPDHLIQIIRDNFNEILNNKIEEEFCRINTELLVRVTPLRGDIYIRLSNVKFIKLFKSGTYFTQDDLEKFMVRKKVNFFYIKKTESQEFVQKFREDLNRVVEDATADTPGLHETIADVQDLVQELANRIGFTTEVQELARNNVQLTLKTIGQSPRLASTLAESHMKGRNYISSHSIILANVSCSIAAQMQWPSNTTYHKLVLASLFHDFSLHNPDLAKISTKAQMEELKDTLSPEQYESLRNHPFAGAGAIKNLREVPGDVEFLIAQHHERPDGSGFPKGLRGHQIAPLAAVFIVAHDIVDCVIHSAGDFDLNKFLKVKEPHYQTGPFKKIWQILAQNAHDISKQEEKAAA